MDLVSLYPFYNNNSDLIIYIYTHTHDIDINPKQSRKKSQGDDVNENMSEHNDSSDILGPTYIGGVSGGLLSSCISNNIPCIAVLVPSLSGIPDPEGAAIILETLAKVTSYEELKIDVNKLRMQGNRVKKNLDTIYSHSTEICGQE